MLRSRGLTQTGKPSCIGYAGHRPPFVHCVVYIIFHAEHEKGRSTEEGGITRLAGPGGADLTFFTLLFVFVSKRGETTSPSYRRIFYTTTFFSFVGLFFAQLMFWVLLGNMGDTVGMWRGRRKGIERIGERMGDGNKGQRGRRERGGDAGRGWE